MPSNHTANYELNQWEKSDHVLMDDFNTDNAKIDAAIKTLEDNKASVSELNTLRQTVNSLSGSVSGHTSSISKLGNCQIEYFTANLVASANTSVVIRFSKEPDLFLMLSGTLFVGSCHLNYLRHYHDPSVYMSTETVNVTWNGSSCMLPQGRSFNGSYHVIAFYRKDQ